jgi:hypothetical protein
MGDFAWLEGDIACVPSSLKRQVPSFQIQAALRAECRSGAIGGMDSGRHMAQDGQRWSGGSHWIGGPAHKRPLIAAAVSTPPLS